VGKKYVLVLAFDVIVRIRYDDGPESIDDTD
jgi:hypothetical protein